MSETAKYESMEDVLNPTSSETPEVQPEPQQPEVQPQEEPEAPEQAPEQQPEVEAAPPKVVEEPKMVPLDAMLKERDRWKTKAAEYEMELERLKQAQAAPPVEFDVDPQGYVQQIEQKLKDQISNMRLQMSETLVKQTHKDYDAKLAVFAKYVQSNPQLLHQVQTSENPALMAYNLGKQFEFQEQYGSDPESIRQKMKAEIELQLRKEMDGKLATNIRAAAKQPTNVQSVRAAPGGQSPRVGYQSFKDILGR